MNKQTEQRKSQINVYKNWHTGAFAKWVHFSHACFVRTSLAETATAIKISLHSLGIPNALFWPPPSDSKVWSLPPFWESSLEGFYICLIRKGYLTTASLQAEAVLSFNHLTFHLGTEITFSITSFFIWVQKWPFSQEPQALLTWCHTRVSAGHGAHGQRRSGLRSWCSSPWSLSHGCRFQFCSSAGDTSSLCLQ